MNALVRSFLVFALLLLANSAVAAPAITITVRDAGVAKVVTTDLAAGTFCSVVPFTPAESCARCPADAAKEAESCKTAADKDDKKRKACDSAVPATKARCEAQNCLTGMPPLVRTPTSFTVQGAGKVVSEGALTDGSGELASNLLNAGAVWCLEPGKSEVINVPVSVPLSSATPKGVSFPLSSTAGAWRDFNNANRFAWLGWDRPAFLRVLDEKLQKEWKCEFKPASQTVNGCRLTRVPGSGGGLKLVFDADRPLSKDSTITVWEGTNTNTLITVPLDQCTYTAQTGSDSGLDAVYADAEEERIEVTSSSACLNQLRAFTTFSLVLGSTTIQATSESFDVTDDDRADKPKRRIYLRMSKIAADVALGAQEFELRIAQSVLGSLRVQVRPAGIRAPEDSNHHPQMSVSYDSSELDAWHSGRAIDGLAVVTPVEADPSYAIYNRLSLDVDSSLQRLGERLSSGGVSDQKRCQDLWSKYRSHWYERDDHDKLKPKPLDPTNSEEFCVLGSFESQAVPPENAAALEACAPLALEEKVNTCHDALSEGKALFDVSQEQAIEAYRNQRAWRLTESSWGGDLWFDEDWLRRAETRQVDVSHVVFSVYQPQTEKLRAKAELRDRSGSVLFRSTVVLADGARRESLPLPLGGALRIECGRVSPVEPPYTPARRFGPPQPTPRKPTGIEADAVTEWIVRDTLQNGAVRAVFDADLDSGSCVLVYSPKDMKKFLHRTDSTAPAESGADPSPADESAPDAASEEQAHDGLAECQARYKLLDDGVAAAASSEQSSCQAALKANRKSCDEKKTPQAECERQQGDGQKACDTNTEDRRWKRKKLVRTWLEACKNDLDVDPLLHLYGSQLVEVVLTRGTEPNVTKAWAVDPAKESRLPLPGIKARSGDYTVAAHLKGPSPLGVIYRPSPQQLSVTPGNATDLSTDLEFRALMRPRGISGFLRNWRAFITFPIRFSGLRFPAKSSALASSGDPVAVQLAGVRAGMLAIIEPWNYDTRENRGWIPWRFATGFNLYDLGTGKFDPAYLLGLSITLPILPIDGTPNARNLNSSLAIGGFWEVDLQRDHPLKDGNHFLLTFGLDLASLLSE